MVQSLKFNQDIAGGVISSIFSVPGHSSTMDNLLVTENEIVLRIAQ